MMAVLLAHHSAAQCLVLPLNIHYRDNTHYHEAIFLLQAAAFIAVLVQQIGFALNIKERVGLFQMRALVTVSFAVIAWSRILRYAYLWYILLTTFIEDGNWLCLELACAPVVLLSAFNVIVLIDVWSKLVKFWSMRAPISNQTSLSLAHVLPGL